MHPNHGGATRQQRLVQSHAHKGDSYTFFNLLTGTELFDQVESLLPQHRERLFPPTETLSMFLAQALSADRSCQKAVDEAATKRLVSGLPLCSTHTGAYCQARQRLPVEMVSTLARYTGRWMSGHMPESWHWRGRRVRLVDGTTLRLPDTSANQGEFAQPDTQRAGLGYPRCRVVGVLCLGSGALLDAAMGPYQGKGSGEQSLLRTLLDVLEFGDVLLGDAYYATYFLLCALRARGVDAVFEQHGARQRVADFRCGQRLGPRDHLIELAKPAVKPEWMSQADYDAAPASLTVREVRAGGKILLTTLQDAKRTPQSELQQLYRLRWHIELDLRNIKTTLGMEQLSCKTPAMARKEIWIYLLAYNLIRLMMAQAAQLSRCEPRALSFKHTLQLWIAWHQFGPHGADHAVAGLFVLIAQQRVGGRPGRIEPRAIKRRAVYPLLMQSREIARAKIRKYGHPKHVK
jgi:hypothetical protein